MNINPFIFYPLLIGLLIFTYAFFKWPKYALAGLIIAKPIIDVSWNYNIFLNINFLKIYAGLFVILGVIYIIVKRVPILTFHGPLLSFPISNASFPRRRESSNCHPEPKDCYPEPCLEPRKCHSEPQDCHPEPRPEPRKCHSELGSESTQNSPLLRFSVSPFHFLSILWLIFLGLNIVSIFIISDAHLLLGKINYFLRILTGFIALIMFAYLFDFKKDKKFVLLMFIAAGIFPLLLWLIPVLFGSPIISNDPLQRIMGPYHNFWNFNFYALQTIICCLAYLGLSSRHCEERSDEAISTSSGVEPVCVHRTGRPLGSSKSASSTGIEPSANFLRSLRSIFSFAFLANFQRSLRFCHCEERSDEAISISSQPHNFPPFKLLRFLRLHLCAFANAFQRFLRSIFSSASFAKFLRSLRLHFSVSPFRMMAFIMLIVSVAMIYKCYSKAGWITLAVCFFIWFLLRKKYILASLIPVITAIIVFVNPFAKDFQKTFQDEINYFVHGSETKEMVFRGRLNRWEMGMISFNTLPVINKLFGTQKSIGNPENDYLRVLWNNGIIGFIAFLILLGLTGYLLIRKYVKNKHPAILMGILIFTMFLISGIGSYSMYYPNLQWFMWGTVGFILSKDRVKLNTKD